MAYRPGQYVREFFRSGGFTLTDKSPNYTSGKIPLFKSIKNLNRKELIYAVGYNLSTLGAFGLNFGQVASMGYAAAQFGNTLNSFRKNLRNPSNVLGGQIIGRQKLLGAAKIVGKIRPQITSALKTNTPIDRATNILVGRESAALLKQARSVGSGGIVMQLVQELNPSRMDNALLNQAQIPSKGNVFIKWRNRTFAEAYMNAPNPYVDNPIMQMRKQKNRKILRNNINQGKKGMDVFDGIELTPPSSLPINIDKVLSKLSLVDADNLGPIRGTQKSIAFAVDSAVANQKYANNDRIMGLTQKARNELMREHEYNRINRLMAFAQGRDYIERGSTTNIITPRLGKVGAKNANGVRVATKEDDIQINRVNGQIDTHNLRNAQLLARKQFFSSLKQDISTNKILPSQMFLENGGMDVFNEFLRAFNFPTSTLKGVQGPMNAADLLSKAITQISYDQINDNINATLRQRQAIAALSSWMLNNGYQNAGAAIGYLVDFGRNEGSQIAQGAYAVRASELNKIKEINKRDGIAKYITGTQPQYSEARFRPAGIPIYESELIQEVVGAKNVKRMPKVKGIGFQGVTNNVTTKQGLNLVGSIENKTIQVKDKLVESIYDGTLRKYSPISYVDIISGDVPGISVRYIKGKPVIKTKVDKLFGKSESWWQTKIDELHKNYVKVAVATKTYSQLEAAIDIIKKGGKATDISAAWRNLEKNIRSVLGRRASKASSDDIYEYILGTFEYTGGNGSKKGRGRIEDRGLSTFANPALDANAKSQKMRTSHNYVPTKVQIQRSIHMHRMERQGRNENDGTDFLFRYSVSAGGISPKSKYADGIRDMFSIEFGGPAHDRNYTLEHRTDGMFYLPSNLMGKAGTRAAAFFGIFDTGGGSFKARAAGSLGQFRMVSSVEGVYQIQSPYDISSKNTKVRRNLKKDEQQLKKNRRDGVRRVIQLERDLSRAIKEGASPRAFNRTEQSVALQRQLSLYKKSGAMGVYQGGDIFKQIDSRDKTNLGLDPDSEKFSNNFEMRISSLGFYGKKRNRKLGEFSGSTNQFDFQQGHDGKTIIKGNFYQNMATGNLVAGEMPVINLNDSDIANMRGFFTNSNGKVNYGAMSQFTGIPDDTLRKLGWKDTSSKVFIEKFGHNLTGSINLSNDPVIQNLLENPFEQFAIQFNLHKSGGPFRQGRGIPGLGHPDHPVNIYKKIFLSEKFERALYAELVAVMERKLAPVIAKADKGTRSIIDVAIKSYAKNEVFLFRIRQNKIAFKNLNAFTNEDEFRRLLQSQAYNTERALLKASDKANKIAKSYAKEARLDKKITEEYFKGSVDDMDWESLDSVNFIYSLEDGEYKVHLRDENSGKVVTENFRKVDRLTGEGRPLTTEEMAWIDYYDPGQQAFRDFAANPLRGDKIVHTGQNSIATSVQAEKLRNTLMNDDVLYDQYKTQYGSLVDRFIQGGNPTDDAFITTTTGHMSDLHLTHLEKLEMKVINTTGQQTGGSYVEVIGVNKAFESSLRGGARKKMIRVLQGQEYMDPYYLGNLFWQGKRSVSKNVPPQEMLRHISEILTLGKKTGYFRSVSDEARFVQGIWHHSVPLPVAKNTIKNRRDNKKFKYTYGITSKSLDGFMNQENLPDTFWSIRDSFSLLPSQVLGNKYVISNTISDVPHLRMNEFKKIVQEIKSQYPVTVNNMQGVQFLNFTYMGESVTLRITRN